MCPAAGAGQAPGPDAPGAECARALSRVWRWLRGRAADGGLRPAVRHSVTAQAWAVRYCYILERSGTVLSRHYCFIKASVGAGGSRHCLSSSSLARPRGCTNSLTLPRVPVAMVRILHVVGVCRRHGWDLGCKHHAAWALHMLCRRVRLSSCLLYSPGEGSGQSVCATALFDGRCQSLGMHRFTASGTGGSLARRSKCYGSLWRAV